MDKFYTDNFLARWMNNELSEEELQEFRDSPDYMSFQNIVEQMEGAEYPDVDENESWRSMQTLIQKAPPKKTKVRQMYTWVSAVAAVFIIAFVFLLSSDAEHLETASAEHKKFTFPCGSIVELNAESQIEYEKGDWDEKRSLNLSGEAYFKVSPGSEFSVHSKHGTVKVLGTAFNISDRKERFEVDCYEGKVSVESPSFEAQILEKGDGVFFANGELNEREVKEIPDWMNGESSFYNTDIVLVIDELERQFGIEVKGEEKVNGTQFSGRFMHDELEKAAKTIFEPLDIPYSFDKNGDIVIQLE
ncbi:MAG: FecR domain-containing protein [Bacteroidota bacterium]